jgi:hypothetical protein
MKLLFGPDMSLVAVYLVAVFAFAIASGTERLAARKQA